MKKIIAALTAALLCASLPGCSILGKLSTKNTVGTAASTSISATKTAAATTASPAAPSPTVQGTATPEPTASPSPTATAAPTASLQPTATPSPSFGEQPDHAGSKNVRFDIYVSMAQVDLNGDGKPEQLVYTAGKTSATLSINSKKFKINKSGLAQRFAVTDVNTKDKILELVFTDKYDGGLADSEKAYSYLYWWNGTALTRMGGLMDVKFDGKWRMGFQPSKHFNGAGMVTCLARTTEFTDVWYMAHYKPTSATRTLKEEAYTAKPINPQEKLKVKTCCLLLKKITTKFFSPAYYSLYDAASWPHSDVRVPDPGSSEANDFTVIAQKGESLTLVAVYGKYWYKLKTADGYQGWVMVKGGKMQGYWQVMKWTVNDMLDGIMVAG